MGLPIVVRSRAPDEIAAAFPPSYSSRAAFNTLAPEALPGVQPQFTANSIAAPKAWALAGLGVAIVPELTGGDAPGEQGLVLIGIIGAQRMDTRMCLCRRQSRILGTAARRLLDDFVVSFLPAKG
jgi:DNA-binding transcriptional LysR family regulator